MPSVFTTPGKILVTCPKRFPEWLAQEVRDLGFTEVEEFITGIETRGTVTDAMSLNLNLRTGYHVLYHLKDFQARTPGELYAEISRIPWENYLPKNGYLSINSSVRNDRIRDTRFANLKCKDAIVDRLSRIYNKRPDSGPEPKGSVVFLRWKNDQASIYLDTSGTPLTKRGYRKNPYKAPMHESLAAALVMASGWSRSDNFINPMCGSGTLAIEAALIGLRKAPGILRQNFGFMHLKGYTPRSWEEVRNQATRKARKSIPGKIIATDIDPDAIAAARSNAATAGVEHLIDFHVCDFRETPIPEGGGVVMLNPEYGERLGNDSELLSVYSGIGDFFKQQCAGYFGYVFTGNMNLAKAIGLRTSKKIPFFNSTIDCRLLAYELYEGSKKN